MKSVATRSKNDFDGNKHDHSTGQAPMRHEHSETKSIAIEAVGDDMIVMTKTVNAERDGDLAGDGKRIWREAD